MGSKKKKHKKGHSTQSKKKKKKHGKHKGKETEEAEAEDASDPGTSTTSGIKTIRSTRSSVPRKATRTSSSIRTEGNDEEDGVDDEGQGPDGSYLNNYEPPDTIFVRGVAFNPCIGVNIKVGCFIVVGFVMITAAIGIVNFVKIPSEEDCAKFLNESCREKYNYLDNSTGDIIETFKSFDACRKNGKGACSENLQYYRVTSIGIAACGFLAAAFLLASNFACINSALVATLLMGLEGVFILCLEVLKFSMSSYVVLLFTTPSSHGMASVYVVLGCLQYCILLYCGVCAVALFIKMKLKAIADAPPEPETNE